MLKVSSRLTTFARLVLCRERERELCDLRTRITSLRNWTHPALQVAEADVVVLSAWLQCHHLHLICQWLGQAQIESTVGGKQDGYSLGWRWSCARSGTWNLSVGRAMIERRHRLLRQLCIAGAANCPHQTHASVKTGRHFAAFMGLVAVLDLLISLAAAGWTSLYLHGSTHSCWTYWFCAAPSQTNVNTLPVSSRCVYPAPTICMGHNRTAGCPDNLVVALHPFPDRSLVFIH